MASMPGFEKVLFEVHRCLDIPFDSKKRDRLFKMNQTLSVKQKYFFDLIENMLDQLDLDADVSHDLVSNISAWGGFNQQIRTLTCTHQAELKQVIWYLFGYLYMPGLGRQLAYWHIDAPLDKGMPGGGFWYLPNIVGEELKLPVVQVFEWLEDLLEDPLQRVASSLAGGLDRDEKGVSSGTSADSHLRTLYNWRSKKASIPKVSTINTYFSNETQLDFTGAFHLETGLDTQGQFERAKAFVEGKGLIQQSLSHEFTNTRIVERALSEPSGQLNETEKIEFIEMIAERYAQPSMRTVRQRLIVARTVQAGYKALVEVLLGADFDDTCTDLNQNKALQLIAILKMSYNLAIDANLAFPNDWSEQEKHYDAAIPELYRQDLFLSVMKTVYPDCTKNLTTQLSQIFEDLAPSDELETLLHYNQDSWKEISTFKQARWSKWAAERKELKAASKEIRSKSPWRVMQKTAYFRTAYLLLQDSTLSFKAREQACRRIKDLAISPEQQLYAIFSELSLILDNENCQYQTKESSVRAEALLVEAKFLDAKKLGNGIWLNYKAKHLISSNQFDEARKIFKCALEACGERSYGQLHGQIARDGFALDVGLPREKFSLTNYEYYYQNLLLNCAFEDDFAPNTSFEDVAVLQAEYFWSELYKPYPGVTPVSERSLIKVEAMMEGFKLLLREREDEFTDWLERHKSDLGCKRSKDLRGDTALMLFIKMLFDFENKRHHPLIGVDISVAEGFSKICETLRIVVLRMIDAWPKLVDMYDYKRQSPLMLAVDNDEPLIRDKLLSRDTDVCLQDFKGRTVLHAAVAAGSLQSLKALLEARGGDRAIHLKDIAEHSILHIAVKVGSPQAVGVILSKQPALADAMSCEGQSPRWQAQELAKGEGFYSLVVNAMRENARPHGSISDYRKVADQFLAF